MNPATVPLVLLLTIHTALPLPVVHKTFREKCEIFNTYAGTAANIATIIVYAARIGIH